MRANTYAKKQAKILSKEDYIMNVVKDGEHWMLVWDGNEHKHILKAVENGEIQFPAKITNDKKFRKMDEEDQIEHLFNILTDMIQVELEKLQ